LSLFARGEGGHGRAGSGGEGFASSPVMLANLRVPLGWKDLFKRSLKEAWADNILDLSAQQAYYFFFALFPALLFVIAVASFFPLQGLIDDVVAMIGRIAPKDVVKIITDSITSLSKQNSGGILTFAFFVAIWSSSGAMVSIITTLNTAYDVTESRPWWRTRLTAIALTVGIAIFILASMFLVIAGPTVAERIAARMQLGPMFTWTWMILQWPVVFALVATAIGLVYYFAPDVEQDWVWITPGSILAALLWLAVSLGLKFYYQMMPEANAAYGTIGGVMVLMLWFYVSGLALLFGAELNAEIEHASPYGKQVGERVPGEKKVVGPRAERLYEEKKARGEVPIKPMPEHFNCDIDRAPAAEHSAPKTSDLIIGALALAPAAVVAVKKAKDEFKKSA
jgi:membrane protein